MFSFANSSTTLQPWTVSLLDDCELACDMLSVYRPVIILLHVSFQTCFTEQKLMYEFIHEVDYNTGFYVAHMNHVNDAL